MYHTTRGPVHSTNLPNQFELYGFQKREGVMLKTDSERQQSAFQISNLQNIATDAGGWSL